MSARFPARRSRGGDLAAPTAVVLLLAALAAVLLATAREPSVATLLLCCLAAVLAVAGALLLTWAMAYRRLTYSLTESALRIDWLGATFVLPYPAIQGIYTGQRLSGHSTPDVPRWPGINVGPARVRGLGRLRFFATSSDQSQLTLITVPNGGVIVSAQDPPDFQAALIDRVERYDELPGDAAPATWQRKGPSRAPWTALADGWLAACIGFGILAVLLILASVTLPYDSLPDQLPLHFDVTGEPSQIAPKSDLLRLPLLGLVCLVLNAVLGVLVHPRERVLGRLLWLGGVVVQLVVLVGVARLLA